MWTAEQRARHKVSKRRDRLAYATDISDKEWKLVGSLLPSAARAGRPRKTVLRALRCTINSGHACLKPPAAVVCSRAPTSVAQPVLG